MPVRLRRYRPRMAARALVGASLAALLQFNPAHAATQFGASVFPLLDDPDAGLRAYGWKSIEALGRVSEANPLEERRFRTFVDDDHGEITTRIIALFGRTHPVSGTLPDKAEPASADPELREFVRTAKVVPEVAALAARLVEANNLLASDDLHEILQEAQRSRRVRGLKTAPAEQFAHALAVLFQMSAKGDAEQLNVAGALAEDNLPDDVLDQLPAIAKSETRSWAIRGKLALALARNGRIDSALEVIDDLLADPSRSEEARSLALDVMIAICLKQPARGRVAVAARVDRLLPLLGDTTFLAAASLLSQLSDDQVGEKVSVRLLSLIEQDEGLVLSSCVHVESLPRSPKIPFAFGLLAHKSDAAADRYEKAGCAMLLTPSAPQRMLLKDLALGRNPQDLDARRQRLALIESAWGRLDVLETLSLSSTADGARRLLVEHASGLLDAIPLLSFSGPAQVETWIRRAEPLGLAPRFAWAYWTRWIVTWLPVAAGALGIWFVALVIIVVTSRSDALRAFLLFHPFGRQIGAFGQVKTLVFAVPRLRRRFFRPYKASMLGELGQIDVRMADGAAYFTGSGASELQRGGISAQMKELDRRSLTASGPIAQSVVEALGKWSGRVMLIGPSGRGKTMFLRHHVLALDSMQEPTLFASASLLGADPLKSLAARFGDAVPDEAFIDSLIRSGRIDLYIDGLNEADPDTRAAIVDFITARSGSRIFVTTQPLERYPAEVRLFALLPLTRAQVTDFLMSREKTLGSAALLSGEAYRAQSRAFVAERLAEADVQKQDSGADETERANALVERLSNPMDLQTIADLLSLGQRPNVWGLQKQRHLLVERRYCERTNNEGFPLSQFSRAVYECRRDGRPEVDDVRFPRVAEILLEEKQIQRYVGNDPTFKAGGYVFRHDKIRDFYACSAFVDDPALRVLHAGDDQFSGIYDLLSLELPIAEAAELREFLAERALDRGDHRLSDRYLDGLRTRRALERKDPDWLSLYDRADVATENAAIARWDAERELLLAKSSEATQKLDASRAAARMIAASRSDALLSAIAAALEEVGLKPFGVGAGQRPIYGTSEGFRFGVLGLAHHSRLPEQMVAALEVTISLLPKGCEPTLIVVNAEADIAPDRRSAASSVAALAGRLADTNIALCSALDLLVWTRRMREPASPHIEQFWRRC